jgi:two-component system KDP operon response regulator KdpE
VLVVDGDPQILRALRAGLGAAGYGVDEASTAEAALALAAFRLPDAILVERVLPGGTAMELLRDLRSWSLAPVIVMSGPVEVEEIIAAFDAGADGHQTKPFAVEELLARLRAVLRRTSSTREPVIELGDLVIDLDSWAVSVRGVPVHLTPRQFRILHALARSAGKLLTGRALLRQVWGPPYERDSYLLHTHVSLLRRKLEPERAGAPYIQTVRGVGYQLVTRTGR